MRTRHQGTRRSALHRPGILCRGTSGKATDQSSHQNSRATGKTTKSRGLRRSTQHPASPPRAARSPRREEGCGQALDQRSRFRGQQPAAPELRTQRPSAGKELRFLKVCRPDAFCGRQCSHRLPPPLSLHAWWPRANESRSPRPSARAHRSADRSASAAASWQPNDTLSDRTDPLPEESDDHARRSSPLPGIARSSREVRSRRSEDDAHVILRSQDT